MIPSWMDQHEQRDISRARVMHDSLIETCRQEVAALVESFRENLDPKDYPPGKFCDGAIKSLIKEAAWYMTCNPGEDLPDKNFSPARLANQPVNVLPRQFDPRIGTVIKLRPWTMELIAEFAAKCILACKAVPKHVKDTITAKFFPEPVAAVADGDAEGSEDVPAKTYQTSATVGRRPHTGRR